MSSESMLNVILSNVNCVTCNSAIREKIFDSMFMPNLLTLFSAFIALAIVVGILAFLFTKRHNNAVEAYPNNKFLNPVPFSTAAIVMGIGIGGFLDGILLHQILQWHEMISNKLPPDNYINKSVNMFWDGIFHLFTLIIVIIGTILFWKLLHRKNIDKSGNILAGGLIAGWGLFNIVEGIIDHHLLKIHNVRELTANPEIWNYGFLIISIVMVVVGYRLIAKRENRISEQTLKNTTFG